MPGPTPPLCSSFRNTEELTALVSTGKSAWLQREQGTAVIPPPGLPLPGPYRVYLSRRNQPFIPVSCDVPELPDSSAEPEPTCRKRSDSDCVVLCVCVGKGHVQQLIRGPACLPVCGLESSSIWWLRVCQLGSWGTFQPWEGASGCSHYCGCCHALAVFTCARKKKSWCQGSELELTAELEATGCWTMWCVAAVAVSARGKVFCHSLSSSNNVFLLNVAVLCVLTVAV